jgi:hypothetical protein
MHFILLIITQLITNCHPPPLSLLSTPQSGIRASDDIISKFENLKMKKSCQYMVFRIVKDQIVVGKEGEKGASWDSLKEELLSNPKDGAYAVYDYTLTRADGSIINKLVFVSWVPDSGLPVKAKMLYGSTSEGFKSTLNTPFKVLQASDIGDLSEDKVKDLIQKV